MANEQYYDYPKARISAGSGDLVDVYDASLKLEDGEKSISTLRANPSGSTRGASKATLTFKSYTSEHGDERPYWRDYKRRKKVQYRLKVPGMTHVIVGRLTSPGITGNVDNAIDSEWTVIGLHTFEG